MRDVTPGYHRVIPLGLNAGAMTIDYDTFVGTLKEIGYQGYLVYEMCEVLEGGGSIKNLDDTARKFLKHVEKYK